MEQGPVEGRIIEQCMRERLPLPDRMQNAPSLLPGLHMYYQAFLDLTSCRMLGISEGPIPWTATQQYAVILELNDEMRDDLHYYIREMDNAYLKYKKSKQE